MLVVSVVLWAWTVSCWFTELLPEPFLGIGLLSISPVIPFLLALASTILGCVLWFRKHGERFFKDISGYVRQHRTEIVAVALILVLHIALEIPSVVMHRGSNDWDSAIWGLSGYHIANGTERPIFGYGYSQGAGETQHYDSTLSPHISGLLMLVFGPHPEFQRLVQSLFYVGFIACMYLFMRRFWAARTSLLAVLFFALAPASVFKLVHLTGYPEALFFGSLALLLTRMQIEKAEPDWRLYFWIGLTLGFGFYVYTQIIFCAGLVLVMLVARDPLFFIRSRFAVFIPAMIIGALPALIDAWYYQGFAFQIFTKVSSDGGNIFASFFSGLSEMWRLLSWHLGGMYAVSPDIGERIVSDWLLYPVFLAILGYCVYLLRNELKGLVLGRERIPGASLFLINALVVTVIFALSSYSAPPASYRHTYMIWLSIPALSALAIDSLFSKKKMYYLVTMLLVAGFFLYTILFYDLVNTVRQETYFTELEEWLRAEEIDRIYGSFATVYNLAFSTREEIIGSTAYHWEFDAYKPYATAVAESAKPAYFFLPQEKEAATGLIRRLDANGVSFSLKRNHLGILVSNLNPRISVDQVKQTQISSTP